MAGRISADDIAALRDRADIAAIVAEYTTLKRAGARLKGLCPFHSEKTPSFTVDPGKGYYHCLAGETGVITWDGTVPISKLAGSVHRLLTSDGTWIDAEVASFGVQPLAAVHLSRNRVQKTLYATAEHQWFLRVRRGGAGREHREVRRTSELLPGDRLAHAFSRPNRFVRSGPPATGIAQGFTFGDGSRLPSGARADFHGTKDEALLRYFPHASVARQMKDGRKIIDRLPRSWKDLPRLDEGPAHLYGWLAGYFAADGCVSMDGQVILSCADREVLEFVRTLATRIGIGTYGVKHQRRRGYSRTPVDLFHLTFIGSTLDEKFFVLSKHRERFEKARTRGRQERRGWVVTGVEDTERVEEVFCAIVPGTHAFALEDNILTHNCFGCGEGGDVYDFVQKIEALSFTESVERIARATGYTIRYEEMTPGQKRALGRRTRLSEALAASEAFFRERLASDEGAPAREYLASRDLSDAADHFRLGWAPDSWDGLVRHLHTEGFAPQEAIDAGVASEGRKGPLDRFRGRLIFPIVDRAGRDVIAFGGRILPGLDLKTAPREGTPPKYINSPETEVYKKTSTLYGLNWARSEIQRTEPPTVIVVEGYVDVIGLHLAGVRNAVATCGTALTTEHFRLLETLANRVVLALDADDAGFAAADRARALAEEAGIREVGVLPLPPGTDPADLGAQGPEAVEAAMAEVRTAVAFQIEHLLRTADTSTPEGQVAAYHATFDLLTRIGDRSLRYRYIRDRIAPAVGLPADRIEADLEARLAADGAPESGTPRSPTGSHPSGEASVTRLAGSGAAARGSSDSQTRLERVVLRIALTAPEHLPTLWAKVDTSDFTHPQSAQLFSAIREAGDEGFDGVLARLSDDDMRARVRGLALSEEGGDASPQDAHSAVRSLLVASYHRQRKDLEARLGEISATHEPDEFREVFGQIASLRRAEEQLKNAEWAEAEGSDV